MKRFVNITGNGRVFRYAVELLDERENALKYNADYHTFESDVIQIDSHYETCHEPFELLSMKRCVGVRVWFPQFSVDTYHNKTLYVINVKLHINERTLILKRVLVNRNDALASYMSLENEEFFEYVTFDIVDVNHLLYDDAFEQFRKTYINERDDLNNESALLMIEIVPVQREDDKYILMDYESNHAQFMFSHASNEMHLKLKTNVNETCDVPRFDCNLVFNELYEQTLDGLKQYIHETYFIDDFTLLWELYIQNDTDTYRYVKSASQSTHVSFDINDINFTSWDEYVDKMRVIAKLYILYDESLIEFESNHIIFNQDVFKYFINTSNVFNIPISQIDMINYNVNIVNKIKKNVVQIDRPADYKANIIRPVFFRTTEAENINVHKEISENVCIALNRYKSQVNMFYIKIENATFAECGRVNEGVIFKIDCGKLTKQYTTGPYYILNENYELVTEGKYTYV